MYQIMSGVLSLCICAGIAFILSKEYSIAIPLIGFGVGGMCAIIGVIADKVSKNG